MINRDFVISSRQNPGIKKLCALNEKKEREALRMFRFDGIKLFCEAVCCNVEIVFVYVRESSVNTLLDKIGKYVDKVDENRIIVVNDSLFDKISEEKSPEGIITVAKHIDKFKKIDKIENEELPQKGENLLIIESMRDPGNLGTVIRSAAALGIDRLVVTSDCADIYNPKTVRAAMGGLFRIKIDILKNELLPSYIKKIRENGRRVLAAALDESAVVLGDFKTEKGDIFVIGNEGHGLSGETVASCDKTVIIPMMKGCESLNAAAASVIFMWEMVRNKK